MIRSNSFISSFKKNKGKYIQRIASVLGMLLVFYEACQVLDYMYVQEYEWGRKLWHDYYASDENIDNLFVGSSHVYHDINPVQLDKINGMNNYDLAVGSLPVNGAYYIIREANRKHALSHVYVELYYTVVNVSLDERTEMQWRNLDNMNLSFNKAEYMFAAVNEDKYWDTVFPFVRYREHLFDIQWISGNTGKKQTVYYKNNFVNGSGLKGVLVLDEGIIKCPHMV